MKLRHLAVAALALCALALAACGPDDGAANGSGASGSATATATVGGGGQAASGRDGCLLGTWAVDLQDLANSTAAKLPGGGTGTSSGSITVVFGDAMTLTYDATLTVVAPASSGLSVGAQNIYAGTATSTDYQAKDGKLAGTMQTNTVTMKLSVIVGNQTKAASTAPLSGALDLAQSATTYTCAGSNLTLNTSGVVWHLTKA